jgi:hypothetical protein
MSDDTHSPAGASLILCHADLAYEVLSEEEAALLDLRSRRFYRLNATGMRVFEGIRAGLGQAEIVARIAQEFEVSAEACQADVEGFLAQMEQADLIRR